MRGAPTDIPVRVPHRPAEKSPHENEATLRHPARQARFAYRALAHCHKHEIAHKTTRRCEHCRALDWQIAAYNNFHEQKAAKEAAAA